MRFTLFEDNTASLLLSYRFGNVGGDIIFDSRGVLGIARIALLKLALGGHAWSCLLWYLEAWKRLFC